MKTFTQMKKAAAGYCGLYPHPLGVPPLRGGHVRRYRLLQRHEKAAAPAGGLRHGGAAGFELVVLSVRPAPDLL